MKRVMGPEEAAAWGRWIQRHTATDRAALLLRDRRPIAVVPLTWKDSRPGHELLVGIGVAEGTYHDGVSLRGWLALLAAVHTPVLDVIVVSSHRWRSLREVHPDWPWQAPSVDHRRAA